MNPSMMAWTVLVSLAAVWAYRRPTLANVGLCLILSVFQAAAALRLGSAFIMPAYLGFLFLAVRVLIELRAPESGQNFIEAARRNWAGLAFGLYCMFSAFVFPRLFAGDILVYPLIDVRYPIITLYPLGPTSQNLNQALYIVTSALFALMTSYAFLQQGSLKGATALVLTVAIVADSFATVQELLYLVHIRFRPEILYNNGGYLILDNQILGGLRRLNGTFNEPSSLGAFLPGLAAYLLTQTIIDPRRTGCGLVAFWSFAVLVMSTSTTAYVGIAVAAIMVAAVTLTYRRGAYAGQTVLGGITLLGAFALVSALTAAFSPDTVHAAQGVLDEALFGKLQSESAAERVKFAQRAAALLAESSYLGVGYGSFRASGGLQLIAGATGVVGLGLFGLYLLRLGLTGAEPRRPLVTLGAKAGALTSMSTLFVSSSDLTLLPFWFFAGIAACSASPAMVLQRVPGELPIRPPPATLRPAPA